MYTLTPAEKEMLDLIENLRKCMDKMNNDYKGHLDILQVIIRGLREDLTRLQHAGKLISIGGILVTLTGILHLVGWL